MTERVTEDNYSLTHGDEAIGPARVLKVGDRYERRARLVRVVDGDTVVVDIDLGHGVVLKDQYLRMFGINAPELRGTERTAGMAARDFVEVWLNFAALAPVGGDGDWPLVLRTIKDRKGKYGRLLARLYRSDGQEFCQSLLDAGHAIRYE